MVKILPMELSLTFPWDKVKKTMPLRHLKKQEKLETGACSKMYISCRLG
jgi:hypothetical protein